jgi:hypothetical protein
MSTSKKSKVDVQGTAVSIVSRGSDDFISLTDIAKYKNPDHADWSEQLYTHAQTMEREDQCNRDRLANWPLWRHVCPQGLNSPLTHYANSKAISLENETPARKALCKAPEIYPAVISVIVARQSRAWYPYSGRVTGRDYFNKLLRLFGKEMP